MPILISALLSALLERMEHGYLPNLSTSQFSLVVLSIVILFSVVAVGIFCACLAFAAGICWKVILLIYLIPWCSLSLKRKLVPDIACKH